MKGWSGRVLVKVTIYHDALSERDQAVVPPYYSLSPRRHYPSFLLAPLSRYYSALGHDRLSELLTTVTPWFELQVPLGKSIPVQWARPLGVLADMTDQVDRFTLSLHLPSPSRPLPPEIGVLNEDLMRAAFFSSLKEADFLRKRQGSGQGGVMDLSKQEQGAVWEALRVNGDWTGVKAVYEKLVGAEVRLVPFKLYMVDAKEGFEGVVRGGPVPFVSGLTVAQAVDYVVSIKAVKKIVTHGIVVDGEMPIAIALQHLTYPDNQLHLVLHC